MSRPSYAQLEQQVQMLEQELASLQGIEKEFQQVRQAFQDFAGLITEGIFECDRDLNITYANPAALKIFGKEHLSSFESLRCVDFIASNDRERAKKNIDAIRLGTYTGPNEYRAVRADGSTFPAFFYAGPVYVDECLKGFRGIVVDLTERRILEKQLLQRQRLDSLGILAGGAAHDFNNLLSGIMGYLNILCLNNENMTEKQKTYIDKILDSVKRGASITNQFHQISGERKSRPDPLDIYPVARDIFTLLERTTDRLIKKYLDVEPGTYYIRGKADELHQVLMNLATNAVQAIEEKGIGKNDYIRMTAYDAGSPENAAVEGTKEGWMVLEFEDTGKGMTETVKNQAFDPLFTTKTSGRGTQGNGLGLAMVHKIVTENLDADISVQSSPGRGCTFRLELKKSSPPQLQTDCSPDCAFGGNETILVVDDDPLVMEAAVTGLMDYGYKVITAADGREGLEIFQSEHNRIHLVLLDLNMPEISGCDLFEKMLKIDPEVRVIITSGYRENYNNRNVLLRAKRYLQKPYELYELEKTVRETLDSQSFDSK